MTKIYQHPFKEAVQQILYEHFSPEIVKRFYLEFEVNLMDVGVDKGLQNQVRDNNLILQVTYLNPDGLQVYICDLFSWMSRKQTIYKLLKYITDKTVTGEIGKDWDTDHTSKIVLKREFETKEVIG